MSTRRIMLDIARKVIAARAVLDGYQAGEYDGKRDDEGYVISILNALHHWSAEYGLDWQAELTRAQEHFDDDLREEQEEKGGAP